MQLIKVKGINLRTVLTLLVLGCFLGGLNPMTPALAQVGGPAVMEQPAAAAGGEKRGGSHHLRPHDQRHLPAHRDRQVSPCRSGGPCPFTRGSFTQNWRSVNAGGDFYTFIMPVKFVYGPTKDLEIYVIVPFIHNWVNNVDRHCRSQWRNLRQLQRHRGYHGGGQIQLAAGNRLPAGRNRRGRGGFSHRPRFPPQPGVPGRRMPSAPGLSTSSPASTCIKYLKPFLVHSQIWMNTPVNLYKMTSDPHP